MPGKQCKLLRECVGSGWRTQSRVTLGPASQVPDNALHRFLQLKLGCSSLQIHTTVANDNVRTPVATCVDWNASHAPPCIVPSNLLLSHDRQSCCHFLQR